VEENARVDIFWIRARQTLERACWRKIKDGPRVTVVKLFFCRSFLASTLKIFIYYYLFKTIDIKI
jgi:hypothetical protein